ncbi:hypothetical protein MKW94_024762 [Papaver nudicaule]|uniref:Uncharacterized protein n=1 Tax=Papaver nudicaule TaxID=74823 RepID=A0AA42AYJ1_PAPNU|nr:hypothetical protein [Papaver nudicaule]
MVWNLALNSVTGISLTPPTRTVRCVSLNPAGSLLATCSQDKSVWIWDVLPGNDIECLAVLPGHSQDVEMVRWHPFLEMVKVWAEEDDDSENWHCVQTLNEASNGHSSTVWGLSFNSMGDRMVTFSDDLTLKIWVSDSKATPPAEDGFAPWRRVFTLAGYHDGTIFAVHRSREGTIASAAADDAIRLFWSSHEARLLSSASYDGSIKIWELASVA